MQRTIKIAALAAATVVAGTAGAFADEFGYGGGWGGHGRYGDSYAWAPGPGYQEGYVAVAPRPMYYRGYGRGYGYYGNGTNHPTPSSTQGDVGPQGNENGTQTGIYRQW
jgi:hypothetical protein